MNYIYSILLILVSNLALAAQVLVVVDGKAITSIDVAKRIEALQLANPQLQADENMRRHLLNNLISEELFHNEAKRLKVSVSEEEMKSQFEATQKDHNFSDALMQKLIKNESLRKQVESQLIWNKLVGLVLYSKIKVSDAEVRDEQKVRKGEIREVDFKQIIFDSFDSTKIEQLQIQAQDCKHLDQLAKENGFRTPYHNKLLLSELNPELQAIIKTIPENRVSEVLSFNKQQQVIMVCSKNVINNPQDTVRIRQELGNRKINAEAQKYLAELKKRIYVEYMNN